MSSVLFGKPVILVKMSDYIELPLWNYIGLCNLHQIPGYNGTHIDYRQK